MSSLRTRCLRLLVAGAMIMFGVGLHAAIVFDDSDPSSLSLSNGLYRFEISKEHGGLLSVVDLSTGARVSEGSRGGCLWGGSTPPNTYVGGCSTGRTFSYAWSADSEVLTLEWIPEAADGLRARVTMVPSTGSALDMTLELSGSAGEALDYVLFPSDVLIGEAALERVLLPILPGIVLNSGFFAENRSYTAKYPGEGMFSDFIAVEMMSGTFAIYTITGGSVQPSILGVVHDDIADADTAFLSHAFAVKLPPGERWRSPIVRWRIGESLVESARAFRRDSEIETLPSVQERLGGLYPKLLEAPFLKIDMEVMRRPFEDYARLIRELPIPSVLHWVGFGARGFDEDYPDFLPPHPSHGSTSEFAELFRFASALGHINMPYTNPTWWDDESPTIRDLPSPLTIFDIAVLDAIGAARYETFGAKGGFAVSPWHPFVRQRADESVDQMTREVPSDLLFQDQIGARPWIFDANPTSPSPTAYVQGWIEHTKRHREVLLGTEQGFDALIPTEIAFFGSVPAEDDDWSVERFGRGNWEPWPFVPIVAGDKVLLYPHNMGANPPEEPTFRLNVAFGQMMMYTLHNPAASIFESGPGGGLDSDGFRIVSALQRKVISRYATRRIEEFEWLAPRVTRTKFDSVEVIANGSGSTFYERNRAILPGGFLITSDDGSLVAGVFSRYGGVPLAPGRHVLIEERLPHGIEIWKPSGVDSSVVVAPLPEWSDATPLEVRAHDVRGDVFRTVPFTRTPYGILFRYAQGFDDTLVSHYSIVDPTAVPRRRGVRR